LAKSSAPKPLFNLTDIQQLSSALFGLSPKQTLNIVQSLYEKHKVLTYPRTDSRYLTSDMKNTIFEIRGNLRNLKCNKTGDSEFDKQCEETITLGKNAYSAKQEAVNKLLKWFDDLQSPKKANEAKKSLEEGGEYWQVFLLKLTALTLTDEDLKDSKTKK